jgi:hypothetical protein
MYCTHAPGVFAVADAVIDRPVLFKTRNLEPMPFAQDHPAVDRGRKSLGFMLMGIALLW